MAANPTSSPPEHVSMFNRVKVDRASQVIIDQLKQLIRSGQLRPGDRLPSERDLCQEFGVSRVTVREALRVLEASGLVAIRVGAHGGAFMTSPTPELLGAGLADLLNLSPLTPSAVTEARVVFEIAILPLVVERATKADVADLLTMVESAETALAEDRYTMEMSAAFHRRVAACTHNPAVEMLVQSFHGPMLMSLREAQVAAPLMGHRGTEEHKLLALAIRDGDLAAATKVMHEHLGRTAERLRSLDHG